MGAPAERAKCLLQVQAANTGPAKYKGLTDVVFSLYREGGLRSIFKGSAATAARDVPASAAYFASYEIIQRNLQGPDRTGLSIWSTLFAGGMAGICNWLVAIPMDVVKSRLQAAPEGTYTGAVDVLKKLLKSEGPVALYKGCVPILLRSFPSSGDVGDTTGELLQDILICDVKDFRTEHCTVVVHSADLQTVMERFDVQHLK